MKEKEARWLFLLDDFKNSKKKGEKSKYIWEAPNDSNSYCIEKKNGIYNIIKLIGEESCETTRNIVELENRVKNIVSVLNKFSLDTAIRFENIDRVMFNKNNEIITEINSLSIKNNIEENDTEDKKIKNDILADYMISMMII